MEMKYSSKEIKELSSKMTNCPFCNGDKCKITSISKGAYQGSYYQGLCNKCWARGPKTSDPYTALEKWNNTYLGDFVPEYILDTTQIQRLIDGDIVIHCKNQLQFNALLNRLHLIKCNCTVDKHWYLWGNYKENSVVCVDKGCNNDLIFGYCNVEYFTSENRTVEELIVK